MTQWSDEEERVKSCVGKHAYPSAKKAWQVAKRYKGGLSAYRCRFCGQWHIGHSRRYRREMRAQRVVP